MPKANEDAARQLSATSEFLKDGAPYWQIPLYAHFADVIVQIIARINKKRPVVQRNLP
jgi:hypothetical protein